MRHHALTSFILRHVLPVELGLAFYVAQAGLELVAVPLTLLPTPRGFVFETGSYVAQAGL